MSNAGPGLSPNKQAQSGKVKATNVHGCDVSAGYLMGGRSVSDTKPNGNGFFKTNQPRAKDMMAGSGGPDSMGGRQKEPQDMVRGKGSSKYYSKPVNG